LGACTTIFYIIIVKEIPLAKIALEREAAYKKALGQVEIKGQEKKGKTPGDWMSEA